MSLKDAVQLLQQADGTGTNDFLAFSLAVHENTDTSDTSQLSVLVRGMDSNQCVTEEFLGLKSMHGTTIGEEIFEVSKCVTEM